MYVNGLNSVNHNISGHIVQRRNSFNLPPALSHTQKKSNNNNNNNNNNMLQQQQQQTNKQMPALTANEMFRPVISPFLMTKLHPHVRCLHISHYCYCLGQLCVFFRHPIPSFFMSLICLTFTSLRMSMPKPLASWSSKMILIFHMKVSYLVRLCTVLLCINRR